MQLKTQYLGRDVREKMRELVLEEHESCECRCRVVAAKQCTRPGTDNGQSRFIEYKFGQIEGKKLGMTSRIHKIISRYIRMGV